MLKRDALEVLGVKFIFGKVIIGVLTEEVAAKARFDVITERPIEKAVGIPAKPKRIVAFGAMVLLLYQDYSRDRLWKHRRM
jgi:hypothetical protein